MESDDVINQSGNTWPGFLVLSLVLLSGCSASAETLRFKCTETVGGNKSDMTITYEGTDQGTLTVKAISGEMVLPATKTSNEGKNDAGETYTVMGIRASGETMAAMPDKAAIEACVKGKLNAEELADEDIVFTATLSCASTAPPSKEPVKINGYVEIAVIEPPSAQVFITKTFVEPTSLAGGSLKIDSLPPPSCDLQQ